MVYRIPIRLAGIYAPEGAPFGRTAQPYSAEALSFPKSYVLDRRVRAYIYKHKGRRIKSQRVTIRVWELLSLSRNRKLSVGMWPSRKMLMP
jgi:endonuclease YncB( thermonuclease family)